MIGLDEYDEKYVRSRERKLRRYAAQIGRLCVLWSSLELDLAHLLIAVSSLDEPTVKNVLMGEMNMPAKCRAILAIGFKQQPSEKWFSELSDTINGIDQGIRIERNRMVHDFWLSLPDENGAETIKRVQISAKVRNEPSTGIKKLHLAQIKPVQPADIARLCETIVTSNVTIIRLRREFERAPFSSKSRPINRLLNPSGGQTA